MSGDISDKTPNAETIAAMAEADAGGGEIFEGAAGPFVAAILSAHEQLTPWQSMDSAPRDRFARYRLADGSGERRGCIDAVAPSRVWVVFQSKGGYWPIAHFNGWKPLSDDAV